MSKKKFKLRSWAEIEAKLAEIEKKDKYLLTGEVSTIDVNADRALIQFATLRWVLGGE